MKTFKKFIVEGDTTAAYDMEKVIVSAAGGTKFKSKLIKNSDAVGKKIIKDLGLPNTGGAFPANSYPASGTWNKFFSSTSSGKAQGSTLTPKTDLMIEDLRISLKTGDAQLMSGGQNEASATFFVAAEQSGQSLNKAVKSLGKHINNLLPSTDARKIGKKGIKGNKTQLRKAGKFKEVTVLKNADDAHHAFKNDMRDLFKSNSKFAEAFVFEAMTGKVKFDNSVGTAEYFLVTDFSGNAQWHRVQKPNAYVKKISKQVNPDVKFKSTQVELSSLKSKKNPKGKSGYYRFWSAVGVGINMIAEEYQDKIDQEYELMTEGYVDRVAQYFKRAWEKVTNYFSEMWNNVKAIVSKSWQALMEFMGFEIEVDFNNNVSW
jgi:hypothetical protein